MKPPHPTARSYLAIIAALLVTVSLAAVGLATFSTARAAGVPGQPVRSCASLAELTFDDGTRVTSVEQTTTEPAICHINLLVPEKINIAVSLPVSTWNGRFQGVGGGGFAGSVSAPDNAARSGYAAAATDTGHTGGDGKWAWSPTGMNWSQIDDFGFRSLHELTVKGKAVTQTYYGQAPVHSYWNGCSTGGRQGLMEAQRYPDDYDGILSAAPAINWDRFIPAELWPHIVMREAGNTISQCKSEAFNQAAITACDDLDGVTDGILDPAVCRFDPSKLIGKKTDCGTITATDAAVVKKIWQGPRRKNGSFLWYGLTPGTGFGGLARSTATGEPLPFPISTDWFKWWLAKDPEFDWRTVSTTEFATYFEQSRKEYHSVLGTDDPNLRRFRDSGGKLIMWHGGADQLIFPQGTVDYYQRVTREMGGLNRTERFARLFMAPGVDHCGGGTGLAPSDPLGALVKWVEHHNAPDTLLGKNTDSTRPICTWPSVPRYKGHGSIRDAASYRCANNY
jgi:hypothetical protein